MTLSLDKVFNLLLQVTVLTQNEGSIMLSYMLVREKLVAEWQCVVGAEHRPTCSLVGAALPVVWRLLGLVLHVSQGGRGGWSLLGL